MTHSIRQQRSKNPMWLYEYNYATLCTLFSDIIYGDAQTLQHQTEFSSLKIQLKEKNKYTLLLEVTEKFPRAPGMEKPLQMRIRLYTDAKLAEVVTYQGRARFQPKYELPNPRMYHRDEKRQINYLLHDWLLYLSRYLHSRRQEVIFS
jgi:uncharacterized protein YqiB (DUF1249 family)